MSRPVRLKYLADLTTTVAGEEPRPLVALEHLESGTGKLLPGTALEEVGPKPGVADVDPGDVLFGKLRPYLAKTWVADRPVRASTELLCLRPRPEVEGRWLGYVTMASRFVDWAVATSDGTKMPRTNWEQVGAFSLNVPGLLRQQEIVRHLDRETARLDALIAAKRRLTDLLREKLVTARRTLFEQGDAASGSVSLRRLVRCLDGQRIPLNAQERALRPGPYPYWGAGRIVDHIDGYLFDEELVLLGEDGAPFFDSSRDVAFRTEGQIWVNNHIHVLRCDSEIDAGWLRHMLNAVDFSLYLTGSTRDKLTQEEMMEIRLPVLDPARQVEQRRRLDKIEAMAAAVKETVLKQLRLLKEHRQALIASALDENQGR